MKPKITSVTTHSTRIEYDIQCPLGWGDFQYYQLVDTIDKTIAFICYAVGKKNVKVESWDGGPAWSPFIDVEGTNKREVERTYNKLIRALKKYPQVEFTNG